jgi:hypothetical protein
MDPIKLFFILLAFYVVYQAFSTTETNNYYYTTKECYGGQGVGAANNLIWTCTPPQRGAPINNRLQLVLTTYTGYMCFGVNVHTKTQFPQGTMSLILNNSSGVNTRTISLKRVDNKMFVSDSRQVGGKPDFVIDGKTTSYIEFMPFEKNGTYSLCDELKNGNLTISL